MTVADALAHPTWKMGPKITVDSSTLMNKGLEVIEAHLLFGAGYDQIDVVVHPQSIVHSMVEMTDGATIAQLSMPDMRLPIGYALSYPGRMATAFGAIDWATLGRLDFEVPDPVAFRCLPLAYEAGRQGGTAPACLNGANEVAVDGFLNGAPAMGRYTFGDRRGHGTFRRQRAAGLGRRPGRRRRRPGAWRPRAWPRGAVAGHLAAALRARHRPWLTTEGRAPPTEMDQREQTGALLRLAVVVVAGLIVADLFGALATVLVVLGPAGHDRPARAGPFCRRQAGGHEGERVFRGLRPSAVVGTARARRPTGSRRCRWGGTAGSSA